MDMPTPPRNPYIAGKALSDARGFFGREDVFRIMQVKHGTAKEESDGSH
jgi:hypothetical protein